MPAALEVLDVIAEPTRRRILDHVREHDRSVGELVRLTGMHQPGVSRHLRVLRDAGLVDVRTDAQRRIYRLRAEPLAELDAWLTPYRAHWSSRLSPRTAPRPHEPAAHEGHEMTPSPSGRRSGWHHRTDRDGRGAPLRTPAPPSGGRGVGGDHRTGAARRLVAPLRCRHHRRSPAGGLIVMSATGDEPVTITCEILRVEPPVLLEHTHVDPGSACCGSSSPTATAASSDSATS